VDEDDKKEERMNFATILKIDFLKKRR